MNKGVLIAIVSAATVFGILTYVIASKRKKKLGIPDDSFDERQEIVHGCGFTIGFFVLLASSFIFACIKDDGIYLFSDNLIEWIFLELLSTAVVMTYLIWHGASITPREEATHDGTYILSIFVGTVLTIMKFPYEGTKDIQNGFYLGILLLYIGVNQLAKRAWDKRRKKDSDDDEE